MKDKVTVIGVAWAGTETDYRGFVDRHGLSFANIADTEGEVYARYGVPYQPAWVFLGTDGSSRVVRGSQSEESVLSALQELAGG